MSPAATEIRNQLLEWSGEPTPELPSYDDAWLRQVYEKLVFVRTVDERMLKLQRAGRIGFVGSMLGLEATLVGSALALEERDWLWSGLREGGAALVRGLPLSEYIAQMYCNSLDTACLLYTSPSPRDLSTSRMPSSA